MSGNLMCHCGRKYLNTLLVGLTVALSQALVAPARADKTGASLIVPITHMVNPSPILAHVRLARGQTLSHLALRYYGNAYLWEPIARANSIPDVHGISARQHIVIPLLPPGLLATHRLRGQQLTSDASSRLPGAGTRTDSRRDLLPLTNATGTQVRPFPASAPSRKPLLVADGTRLQRSIFHASPPNERPRVTTALSLVPSRAALALSPARGVGRRNPFLATEPVVLVTRPASVPPTPTGNFPPLPDLRSLPLRQVVPVPPPLPSASPLLPRVRAKDPEISSIQLRYSGTILNPPEPTMAIIEITWDADQIRYIYVYPGDRVLWSYKLLKVNTRQIELLRYRDGLRLSMELDQPVFLQP